MEIHAPEGHVQSVRDVLIHLGIVTIGILIALGLEQTVEFYHHRELADEARENILNEVRDNKKEIDKQVSLLPKFRADATQILDFVTDIKERGKSEIHSLTFKKYEPQLSNTSWTTAQAIGAINYMPYAEVKRFAAAYRRQDDYVAAENRAESAILEAFGVFSAHNKLEKLSHEELEAERVRIMTAIAAMTLEFQQGQAASRLDDNLLSGRPMDYRPSAAAAPKPEHEKEE